MTTLQKQLGGLNVNGRVRYFDRIANLKRVTKSTWTVERYGGEHRIEGGRYAGGNRREWFVDGPSWNKSIRCTSLMDALRMLENM